jgi:YVTN family beta-propeller protein
VKRRLKLGGGPLGIAAHPSRPEVYVADWYARKITVIDTASLAAMAEIAVGQSPSGIAVTPDGSLLLSADRDSDQVSIIDLSTRKVIATVATGKRPFGVTIDADGKTAYTANVASDDVTVIDIAARNAVATVKSGHRPYAVALAHGRGFVTGQYSGTIDVFDTKTLQPLSAIEACDHPEGIEADATGANVYVACWGDNVLLKIDAEGLKILGKAATGDGPRAFGKFLR